eukprot:CAMPEP_0117754704 /NCGR_PEP_ID=MMETSP0947-20121206/12980_1 /TAXON_ID=44440 /ORGANISM="Chattonella subsalsa, Strain CCMP2191" /LENGTH=271 /DNA_ID=CAMNT_0005573829 /DNA_START=875 /DNA_END=1690 /DNA_ORIENTATION=+
MAAEYASQGYVVICPDHNDASASLTIMPDGRKTEYRRVDTKSKDLFNIRNGQLNERANEVKFVIDQLEAICEGAKTWDKASEVGLCGSILCLQNLAVIGHSFGAATAAQSSKIDGRVKRVVCHDLWAFPISEEVVEEGLDKPAAFLHSKNFRLWKENFDKETRLVQSCTKAVVIQATLRNSGHQNFSDFAAFAPEVNLALKSTGKETPQRLFAAINKFTLQFLNETVSPSTTTAPVDNLSAANKALHTTRPKKEEWNSFIDILHQVDIHMS